MTSNPRVLIVVPERCAVSPADLIERAKFHYGYDIHFSTLSQVPAGACFVETREEMFNPGSGDCCCLNAKRLTSFRERLLQLL